MTFLDKPPMIGCMAGNRESILSPAVGRQTKSKRTKGQIKANSVSIASVKDKVISDFLLLLSQEMSWGVWTHHPKSQQPQEGPSRSREVKRGARSSRYRLKIQLHICNIPGQLTELILPLLHHQLGTNLPQTHQWEWIVCDALEMRRIPRAKIVKRCQHLELLSQNALQRGLLNTDLATTLKEIVMLKNRDA